MATSSPLPKFLFHGVSVYILIEANDTQPLMGTPISRWHELFIVAIELDFFFFSN